MTPEERNKELIRRIVDQAPPLTEEQRAKLSRLLRPRKPTTAGKKKARPAPPALRPSGTLGPVTDRGAYWNVEPDTYIPQGPPLKTSLLDDPERLHQAAQDARESNAWFASLTPEQQQSIIDRAFERR